MDNIQAGRNDNHATIKHASGDDLETARKMFAIVDELESRRIPGTSSFECSGSHSNGYDAGTRWGGCLSDRNAYDGLWKVAGDLGGSVTRSFEQNKSDAEKDTWTKKEVVFSQDGNDGIASRITHKGVGNDANALSSTFNFESLGHLYSSVSVGDKLQIRRLPNNADVTKPDSNSKGSLLTDEHSLEYRAAVNKADKLAYSMEFLPLNNPADKSMVDDIANKLNNGKTRQAAEELQDVLVTIMHNAHDEEKGITEQNQVMKEIADKTKTGHGAKLNLQGEFDSGFNRWDGIRIEPPAGDQHQPHFMVTQKYDGTLDFVAEETHTNQQELERLNPRATAGMLPGFVIQLP